MSEPRMRDVIGDEAAAILDEARGVLSELVELAETLDRNGETAKNARLVRAHVDEFFLLVVIGEVKSGKSSFINALLGEKVQAEGPLPLTDRIWVLRHGDEPLEKVQDELVHEKSHPNELLKLFHIVDTPGTNSIVRRHQEITESFIPRADLTLFVTSIDRPFSETEHQFLEYVNARWRKKVIFVLTKVDTREEEDVEPVVGFIRDNCRKFFDFQPEVFPISARWAKQAKESGDEALREKSGLPALQRFLASNIAEEERVRLKLASPLDAGLSLVDETTARVGEQRSLLEADFRALTDLDAQVAQAARELKERYNTYVVRLYDLLREFERRGKNFFETTLRVKNFGLLKDSQAFHRRFQAEAVGDLKERIQAVMDEATDWLMKEQIGLYERSLRFLTDRLVLDKYKDRVAAPSPAEHGFEYRRDQLVKAMAGDFQREIERFDVQGACARITDQAYRAVLQQIGVQAGSVAIGAGLVAILTGVALDVTGVFAASVLFASGFIILPRKKRQAIQQFSLKVDELIRDFRRAVSKSFDREIDQTIERLRAAWEPYLTFYRAETHRLDEASERQKAIRLRLLSALESVRSLPAAVRQAQSPPGGAAATKDRDPAGDDAEGPRTEGAAEPPPADDEPSSS